MNDNFDDIEKDIKDIIDSDSIEENSNFVLSLIQPKEEKEEVLSGELVEEKEIDDSKNSFEKDFDYVRNNIKDIVAQGADALKEMILVAKASEHPRAYEVVATLMKSLADINKDLLTAHKHNDERVVQNTKNETNSVTNNTIFVGSTAEFSKLMKQRKKEHNG